MSLRRLSSAVPPVGAYTPPGAMKDWVTLYNPPGRDSSTGQNLPPVAFGTTWCKIRGLQGQELDKAQQIAQAVTHFVAMPYQAGVLESMTLVTSDSRTFQIKFIEDPDERKVELWAYCEEVGQNAGEQ